MNARLLATFLCIASFSTGCIIVDNDGGGGGGGPCCTTPPPAGQPGNVTFLWTIVNGRCADAPEVKSVRVTIPGESLYNGGVYACNTSGVDGIVLHDFKAGNYSYTLDAIGYSGELLYTASGGFVVNGNVTVNADLTPGGKSYTLISWYFPPTTSSSNPSCSQAYVTSVKASIDGGEWVTLNCQDGMTNGGVKSPYLNPGTHTLQLVAYGFDTKNRDGMPLYVSQGSFTTTAGSPNSQNFRFNEVGGISVRWDLQDFGGTYRTCAQAGVTDMRIRLKNLDTGDLVYGDAGDAQVCTGAPILYQFLKPGHYEVRIHGLNSSGYTTYSNDSSPTLLTVNAFEQKTASDTPTTVVLYQQ